MALDHLHAERPYLTDGGLETVLIFLDGIDLPEFAAFPLLDDPRGRATLVRYYDTYLAIAERHGRGMILDTPTWRANAAWGAVLGYDADHLDDVNQRAVRLAREIAARFPSVPTVIEGVIGPRGDGYVAGAAQSVDEATRYHAAQCRSFAAAGADLLAMLTVTYAEEGIGVARAGAEVGLPVVVSFTLETDGRLPSGQALGEAVERTDAESPTPPAYYMVNCAHPTHFAHVIAAGDGAPWLDRLRGVRANASTRSHAELDEATTLDRGDIAGLGEAYAQLARRLDLLVVGGCCGTDHDHLEVIAGATG